MTRSMKLLSALLMFPIFFGGLTGCARSVSPYYTEPPEPKIPHPADAQAQAIQAQEMVEVPAAGESDEGTQTLPTESVIPETRDLIHNVRFDRETLYSIASWYTGTGNNWKRLAEANPQIKPRQMRIGQVVRIPEELLVTRRPMPASFLKPTSPPKPKRPQKAKPTPRKPPRPQKPVEAPPLYGPVVEDRSPDEPEKNMLPVPLETID